MKTILKVLPILLVLLLASNNARSQFFVEKKKTTHFQIRGGMNLTNVSAWKNDHGFKSGKVIIGYNGGVITDIMLGNSDVYLQTGLTFTTKGAKVKKLSLATDNVEAKMQAMYVQLPVYFTYKFHFPGDTHFGFAMGPYVAYGVAGKTTYTSFTDAKETKIDTFGDKGLWNRPDVGLGIELQVELPKFVFVVGSDTGLTKAWKREELRDNLKIRNNSVYFTIGYKL
ncbi:porin family protein [Prevotella sp. 10(H)]|uniref:porin family protein n=1 Tax=Prevotella sp. 10(H) TaxID=1158294 RepID=UPI0004A6B7D2|nr:porin family protein [Prevotella sp. 10(H)]